MKKMKKYLVFEVRDRGSVTHMTIAETPLDTGPGVCHILYLVIGNKESV